MTNYPGGDDWTEYTSSSTDDEIFEERFLSAVERFADAWVSISTAVIWTAAVVTGIFVIYLVKS